MQLPWGRKIAYKYIVDGRWTTTDDQPTELDSIGNLNNVLNVPSRPPTPRVVLPALAPIAPEPVPKSEELSQPVGVVNGIITAAKTAAATMVEAIAPAMVETPSPASEPAKDTVDEAAIEAKQTELTEPEVKESVVEPPAAVVDNTVENTQAKEPEAVEPAPEPAHIQEEVPTPKEESTAEAVVSVVEEETPVAPVVVEEVQVAPVFEEEVPVAPIVPVPVLPLTALADTSATNGHVEKPLDTNVVQGSATDETKVEPSAAASEPVSVPNGNHVEPSTHTPAVVMNGKDTNTPAEHASDAHATNGAIVADVPSIAMNGNGKHKPADIPLPLPTPTEIPLPQSPPINGKPAESLSAAPSPPSSPRKEKRHFPSFGRHHRQSSSVSVATSSGGAPDEHGSLESPSRKGTQKRRKSGIIHKIKELFHDDHHKKEKSADA